MFPETDLPSQPDRNKNRRCSETFPRHRKSPPPKVALPAAFRYRNSRLYRRASRTGMIQTPADRRPPIALGLRLAVPLRFVPLVNCVNFIIRDGFADVMTVRSLFCLSGIVVAICSDSKLINATPVTADTRDRSATNRLINQPPTAAKARVHEGVIHLGRGTCQCQNTPHASCSDQANKNRGVRQTDVGGSDVGAGLAG